MNIQAFFIYNILKNILVFGTKNYSTNLFILKSYILRIASLYELVCGIHLVSVFKSMYVHNGNEKVPI